MPGADTGFHFADAYAIGLLFIGVAVFAAVGALSHQRERAFSASLIYLGLGAAAAVVISLAGIDWVDPVDNATLLDHLTEIAVIMALFSAGLKLDRELTRRAWGTTARLLLIAMPITIGLIALLGSQLLGLSAGAALLLGACIAPTDPVLAGDIGVGAAGRRGRARAELRAHVRGGAQRRARVPVRARGAVHDRRGWKRLDRRVARRRRRLRDRRRRGDRRRDRPRGGLERQAAARRATCWRRPSTATTRSPRCS